MCRDFPIIENVARGNPEGVHHTAVVAETITGFATERTLSSEPLYRLG
jgi:hypothetical protein